MDNPNIDNPNPKKEEYVIILDYLKFGYVNPERPTAHGKPIAQAIGVDKFTLIEVTPKEGIDLDIHDKVYIGSGKRDFENLTATSRIELEYAIKEIILAHEDIYVKFFNEIDSLNIKMHKLELIPGIGKKHTQMILEERKKEPFKSFDDLKERVPLLGEPVDMLAKRVRLELDTTTVKRGKNKYYMFTQVPSRHPSNRKKKYNKGRGRGRNNRNKGRKPNNRGKKPQNKPSSENKE